MPPDIRNFFGGNASSPPKTAPTSSKKKDEPKPKANSSKRRVIVDSDDEEETVLPTRTTPKKQAASNKQPSPKYTATTASAYFDQPKPKSSSKAKATSTPAKKGSTKEDLSSDTNGKKKAKTYVKTKVEDDYEDMDNNDNVFAAEYKKSKDDAYENGSDVDDNCDLEATKAAHRKSTNKGKKKDEDDDDFMDVDEGGTNKPKKTAKPRKRKSEELDAQDSTPKKGRGAGAASKKAKKEPIEDVEDVKAVLDDIPLVRPPTPPQKDKDGKYQFNWKNNNNAGPALGASKDIPTGAENCLAGLQFVFTGVLDGLDRTTGINLVKQYGGKVQSAPSRKTNFVVLGADAGPSKLNVIAQYGLKTVNEDGLFQLIKTLPAHGGSGAAASVAAEKTQKEQSKALQEAMELDEQEKQKKRALEKQQKKAAADGTIQRPVPKPISSDSKLWTVKYAPTSLEQIVGNKGQVEKIAAWLRNFRKNARLQFKLAGKDGTGAYRSIMIHGPPGIGKTTAAHLAAKMEGYDIVESNASDARSKRMVEDGLKGVLGTTSLLGYFAGDGKEVQDSQRKLVLIMDEVDGMSAGDRGGVGAMASICKKTKIPIILICNERKLPKMKPFDFVVYDMPFRRPTTDQIRSRIMTIAFREKLKIPPNVLNALIEGTGADIRQVVNMISTIKLDEANLDFGNAKEMSKAWEKHIVLKPWDIASKILGGAMFDKNSKSKLNDKIELYFNDHEFSSLMLQENYLKTNPILANQFQAQERRLKMLELVEKASESISDGDLVDRMIHGTQQQWSLMPTHAVFSFVRPASFVYGGLGYGNMGFTSWLGNNSKLGKLSRMVKEIQGHMRLRCSADCHEVRQQYVPMFWNKLPKRLEKQGKEAIEDMMELMDSYFLTKDDFDAIQELGVDTMDESHIKIDSQTKSAFTRAYNGKSHPLPFMKASTVFAPKRQAKERPDLEEALEESDDGEAVEAVDKDEDEDNDLTKDKYIKAPKKKAAPKATKATSKGKKRAVESDAEESEPKKAKPAAKGKGRGKK